MHNIRYAVQTARSCFRGWRNAPRMLTLMGMIACFAIIYAVPFSKNANMQSIPLQASEIFIALLNTRFSMLLFSSAAVMLFGDLPVLERFTANALMRGTRKSWMAGQALYIVVVSLLLPLFIWLVTLLVALPNITFANKWSRPVKLLALSGRIAIPAEQMKLGMPEFIIRNYLPWEAFSHSFALFSCMSCFFGIVSLMLRMRFQSGSFVVLLGMNIFSWSMAIFDYSGTLYGIMAILSVHYNASLYQHQMVGFNPLAPNLLVSYAILIIAVIIMLWLSTHAVKRYDFVSLEEHHQ